MASAPQVWLITGCSDTIAREVLAHDHIAIASLSPSFENTELVEEITQRGGHWLTLGVTSPEEDIKKTVGESRALYGRLDVVVNNAAFAVVSALEDVDESAMSAQFETNVYGVIKVTKAVLLIMRNARSGTLVNISSVGGLRALSAVSLYPASKHAVEALSEALELEASSFGVRVLLVSPEPFEPTFWDKGPCPTNYPASHMWEQQLRKPGSIYKLSMGSNLVILGRLQNEYMKSLWEKKWLIPESSIF